MSATNNLLRSFFRYRVNPQSEGEVLVFGVAQLPTQVFLISLLQHFKIEWNSLRQVLYIVAVPLDIPFQL